jgi:hypothetical protein
MELNVDIFEILQSRCGLFDVDLFASKLNWQVRKYVSYLPDRKAFAVDAFSISWGQFIKAYAIPPFSILGQVLQKVEEEGVKLTLIAPIWATQLWFFKNTTSNGSRQLHSSEHVQSPSTPFRPEQTSFNSVDETNCVSVIRNSLRNFNIPEKAVDIMLSSWKESTKRQYWIYIKKRLLFCGRKQINPLDPSVNNVLVYLLELYGNRLVYSSIITARSALSALLFLGYTDYLGEHPFTKRLMKGVFNQRSALLLDFS